MNINQKEYINFLCKEIIKYIKLLTEFDIKHLTINIMKTKDMNDKPITFYEIQNDKNLYGKLFTEIICKYTCCDDILHSKLQNRLYYLIKKYNIRISSRFNIFFVWRQ